MKQKYKYLFKNLGILTFSNFASKILVFLLVPLYTSKLSTYEYGVYDLVLTTIQLVFPLFTLNIVDALMRFLLDESENRNSIVTLSVKYIAIALILGIIFVASLCFIPDFQELNGLRLLIYMYFVLYVLNQFLLQLAKGLERVKELGIAGILGTLAMLIYNVLFLVIFNWGITGFFLANILSQFISVIFLFYSTKAWRYISYKYTNRDTELRMLRYCIPLIFTAVGWWVNSASDRYVVVGMLGVGATGILSVSYKIPSIINTVQSIFVQAWQISAIKEYGETDSKEFYGSSFMCLNSIMVILCAGIILLTRPLAHVLYAKDFYQAWQYVPFLVISNVINTSAGFLGPILAAKKNSKVMAQSAIWGAVVNLILNFLLVYYIGIQGATLATMISSYVIYQVRRTATKKEFYIDKYSHIILSWMMLIIQAIIEVYVQNYYIELTIVVIIILLYSKSIIGMMKSLLSVRKS